MTAPKITVTTVDENHPAALAFHALNETAQILSGMLVRESPTSVAYADTEALVLLVTGAIGHLGALWTDYERSEQYSLRVEEKNSELNLALIDRNERIAKVSRTLESLYAKATTDVQKSADYFTAIKTAREELDPSAAPRTPATEAPRRVAAGR